MEWAYAKDNNTVEWDSPCHMLLTLTTWLHSPCLLLICGYYWAKMTETNIISKL